MPLVRSGFIAIPPGPKPGFDHADFHRDSSGATRLYVAHTGADRVEVIDCAANTYLRGLPSHPGVAGVLTDPGSGLLFTSDRAAAQVCIYRCPSEELLARMEVGAHPNGLAFDPARGRLFSFNLGEPLGQNCTASVIDLGQQRVIAAIPLPGRPRWAVYDPATDQVFVNIRDPPRSSPSAPGPWPSAGPSASRRRAHMGCGWTASGCFAPPTVTPWPSCTVTAAPSWGPLRCPGFRTW